MNTAAIVAIATFLVVFLAVCGGAWIVISRRARGDSPLTASGHRRPSTVTVALTVAAAGIVSFVVVIAAARWSLALVEPLLARAMAPFWAIFFKPYGAFVLGVVVLIGGLPFSKRFRRPVRFKTGVGLIAAALVTFWPLQFAAGFFDFRFREWNMILHVAAFLFSVSLLGAGLEMMRRANNTPQDDSWEFL